MPILSTAAANDDGVAAWRRRHPDGSWFLPVTFIATDPERSRRPSKLAMLGELTTPR